MSLRSLVPALLDFERTPGRYPLVLREPRQLFDEAHAVLLLAAGRAIEGLADLDTPEDDARRAARFFVRTALLRSGVDHYTLLGLAPGAEAEQVRDHYRLMIRLTHPDFQASGEVWPADAASRINIANDVLSSPERRAEYHAELEAAAKPAAAAVGAPVPPRHAAPRPQAVPVRMSLKRAPLSERWDSFWTTRVKLVVASLGALLSGGALVLLSPTDSGSLTARKATTVSEDTAAYVEEVGVAQAAARAPVVTAAVKAAAVAPQQRPADPTPARKADQPAAKKLREVRAARPGDPLTLSMDTRLTSPPAGAAAVAPVAAAASVSPVAVAAVSAAPAAHPATDEAPAQRLTMQQVHPALTNVVGSLYSSRAENLMQWVDSDWRSLPANQAFVTQFNQWLAGQRVTQVGKVSFKSRSQGESLVVDGLVEVHLQDAGNQVQVRDLALRAYFKPQDGRPVLTQLVASQAR